MDLKTIFTSKRVWGGIVLGICWLLAHFHVIVSTDDQAKLVNEAVEFAGFVWPFITKWLDERKASGQPGTPPLPSGPAFVVAMLLLSGMVAIPAHAQDVQNLYGFGPNYSQGGAPAVSGTFLYAHKLNDSGTFAFSLMDVMAGPRPVGKLIPSTLHTDIVGGIAQKVATIGKVPIYGTSAVGPSFTSDNTGLAVNFGFIAPVRYKQTNWYVAPNIRGSRSNVASSGDVKVQVGVLIVWGQ